MKKIVTVIAIAICVFFTTSFAVKDANEDVVESLVCQRTDVLSSYYAGHEGKEETISIIEKIETGLLKKNDLENIEIYFQTDIDQVKGYTIKDIDITYEDDEMICANITIEWESESIMGKEKFINCYSVICEKKDNTYKLAQFL